MRSLIRLIMLCLMLATPAFAADNTERQVLFSTEQAAQKTCPMDIVVWVNTQTGVYHYQGMRWYGATKSGAFMCERDRDRIGARPTRNGQ